MPLLGYCQQLESAGGIPASTTKTDYYLNLYLNTDFTNGGSTTAIHALIAKLEKKRPSFSSEKDFLRYLFVKTHSKILQQYTEYCTFATMSKTGRYNCLTGTALYALLLDHFKVDYRVVETNYHIFLVAKTSSGNVLFEATDPLKGFVDSQREIIQRISLYKENKMADRGNDTKHYYQYQFNLFNNVGLDELLGLMYYNLSIDAYNKQDYTGAISYLDTAIKSYQSARVVEFSKIILLTLTAKDIEQSEKENCLEKIQSLRSKMPALASSVNSN